MKTTTLIEDTIELLAKINGLQNVSNLVIEECSELTKELTKLYRNDGNDEHIKEEICDVIITINQLIYCLGISNEELCKEMQIKLGRTLKRTIGVVNDGN